MLRRVRPWCPGADPGQGERGGKRLLPMEPMGCSARGSWRSVINTAGTLPAEEILSGAQGGVRTRTCSPGKELSSSRVRAARHAQPSASCCAALVRRLHCASQQNHFHFLTKLIVLNSDQKLLGSFWVLFSCKVVRKCRSALCGAADLIVKNSFESSGKKRLNFGLL